MSETVLLECSVPRTLDAWLARFESGEWRGTRVEGWLFEGVAARRAAERRLAAAGVQARLRSAYKPLVHFFLEQVDCNGLAAVTVRYPVHPRASENRFLLEAYPLAALLGDCRLEFEAGAGELHYEVELAWHDGRRLRERVFAPNRSHVGASRSRLLSPTGWLRAQAPGRPALDAPVLTDYEQVLERVLASVEAHAWVAQEPFFERLDIRVDLPAFAQPLPGIDEPLCGHEALHEDIYFSLLEVFQRRSGRPTGDRRLQPGQIVPDVRPSDSAPRLRIATRLFLPDVDDAEQAGAGLDQPLEQLETAPHPARIAAEMERLRGRPFGASSRQGRGVRGRYRQGAGAPVFISGGQHANETSGVVGALRAGRALDAAADAHYALIALENPDGYALLRELCAQHACHMHHAARYSALGDDIEYREQAPFHEQSARQEALALSGAQLHVNLHGYPAHEWTRPLSGYVPEGFALWSIPKGFFLVLRHHPGWEAEARALMEQVAAAVARVPGLVEFNARQLALYERHAGVLPYEVLHGSACTMSEVVRPGSPPVTLVTEFPDETVHGEAFRFAHTVQMQAALAAVQAWQRLARP
jgi:hypothetical protein